MKKLEAIINSVELEQVKEALVRIGVEEMTVSKIEGLRGQAGSPRVFRGSEYRVGVLAKLKIEFVVPDALVEEAVYVITKADRTGAAGGRIVVIPVENSPAGGRQEKHAMAA